MGEPAWAVVSHAVLPNGPAQRLVEALRQERHRVGLCTTPLPGATRWRAERIVPGREPGVLRDEPRRVPARHEALGAVEVGQFAWQLAAAGCREVVLVGCDPVAFLEAVAAFAVSPVRVRRRAVWFVDWSAQRLEHRVSGAAYLLATRGALALADVAAAISPAAADAIAEVGRRRRQPMVLTNQPLQLGDARSSDTRRDTVAYVGGLSTHQGVDILLQAGRALAHDGVAVDIVGDGPAADQVARVVAGEPGMRFHGLVTSRDALAAVMLGARVGWALYDPAYAMHSFNDPLKVKDYLAAGMQVVSTLPTGSSDSSIRMADYDVASVLRATRQALAQTAPVDSTAHPMLAAARADLTAFVDAVIAP